MGFPRPQTRARIPISWKEGFGVQKTPFGLVLEKGVFCQKIPFFCKGTHGKWGFLDPKLPFPAFVRATGNGGFWTPKQSFPGNGDSGLCLGSGESQEYCPVVNPVKSYQIAYHKISARLPAVLSFPNASKETPTIQLSGTKLQELIR